jgi:riboflavin kinase/FMN adenylyltransferase
MKIIARASELEAGSRRVCVAIGVFDGVHLGHQQVIRQTIADARQHGGLAVVVTFDRHPNAVLAPERVPPMIYSLPQKLRAIESLGVDVAWLIAFDRAFSQVHAADFIHELAHGFQHLFSVCVGSRFTFGHKRSGNVALLKSLGRELAFTVHGLASVSLDGEAVSSTRIREAIRKGNLDAASQMLGRTCSLCGKVVRGDGLGRQLGFPTANLDTAGLALPPPGVYAAHALLGQQEYRAVLNLGHRPTLSQPNPRLQVEAHLLDFTGELYGRELEIVWVAKLREERKFPSPAALRTQIAQDIAAARSLF